MVIGYTTGVYDLFHIGHLTLLKNAKGIYDNLYPSRIIVGYPKRIEKFPEENDAISRIADIAAVMITAVPRSFLKEIKDTEN